MDSAANDCMLEPERIEGRESIAAEASQIVARGAYRGQQYWNTQGHQRAFPVWRVVVLRDSFGDIVTRAVRIEDL